MEWPTYYFRNGYRRFKRFIAWFPILWHDEDWDHAYLFKIMQFKISRMRKEMDRNQRHVGYEKNVRDMKVAEELLSRLHFSNFYYDLSKELENAQKQGKCACPEERYRFEPWLHPKTGEEIGCTQVDLSCEYCKDMWSRWYKRSDNKEKADFEFLFMHLKKNVKKWWD